MWNYIGTFNFAGSAEENIRITAGATTNQFVVADGLRIVSYDPVFASGNTLAHIEGVDDISVPFGTPKEEALALLSQQTTITDTNNDTYTVDLSWDSESYTADVPGDYQALATFELPEGVAQTDPPTPLEVNAIITVEEDPATSTHDMAYTSFNVYPNPGTGRFTLTGDFDEEHRITVINLEGAELFTTTISGIFNKEINLERQSAGIYILRISGSQINKSQKLIIQ